MLQKAGKKLEKAFLKLDLKLFSGFKHRQSSRQALKLLDPFKANFKARFFCQGLGGSNPGRDRHHCTAGPAHAHLINSFGVVEIQAV